MSCSPFDVRDYVLRELTNPQQLQVEAHLKSCTACREEVERLRVTEMALFTLRDEEIPQRIAFVSDKIFEPSPARRWLAAFWGSTARLGFASAAMLSAALVFTAWHRTPAPATGSTAVVSTAAVKQSPPPQPPSITPEEIDRRVQESVAQAVAKVEARYEEKNKLQLAEFQSAADHLRAQVILATTELDKAQMKRQNQRMLSMVRPEDVGEQK